MFSACFGDVHISIQCFLVIQYSGFKLDAAPLFPLMTEFTISIAPDWMKIESQSSASEPLNIFSVKKHRTCHVHNALPQQSSIVIVKPLFLKYFLESRSIITNANGIQPEPRECMQNPKKAIARCEFSASFSDSKIQNLTKTIRFVRSRPSSTDCWFHKRLRIHLHWTRGNGTVHVPERLWNLRWSAATGESNPSLSGFKIKSLSLHRRFGR